MLSRRRLPLLVAFPALYVGVAAVRAGEARPSAWLLVAIAVAIALVGGRIEEGTEPVAARLRLWTATGLSVAVATSALSTRPFWAAFARELGTLVAMLAALRAIHRIDDDVGLAAKATEAASLPGFSPRALYRAGIAVVALAWGAPALFDGLALFGVVGEDTASSGAPVVAAGAGAVALFALGATALSIGGARRLELAVPPRALACAGAAGAGLAIGVALALTSVVPADAAAALGGAIALGAHRASRRYARRARPRAPGPARARPRSLRRPGRRARGDRGREQDVRRQRRHPHTRSRSAARRRALAEARGAAVAREGDPARSARRRARRRSRARGAQRHGPRARAHS